MANDDVWVCYALNRVLPEDDPDWKSSVEMFVSISAAANVPLTMYMGILRNGFYLATDNSTHKELSLILHSYAAKIMQQRDPDKIYMRSYPTQIMLDILVKSLPDDSYQYSKKNQGYRNGMCILIEKKITFVSDIIARRERKFFQ